MPIAIDEEKTQYWKHLKTMHFIQFAIDTIQCTTTMYNYYIKSQVKVVELGPWLTTPPTVQRPTRPETLIILPPPRSMIVEYSRSTPL